MYNNRDHEFESELEFEDEFEFEQESDGYGQEFSDEFDMEFLNDQEGEGEESMEMEIAGELLTVSNEQELDQFLGSLARKAGRAASNFARSRAGQLVKGALKKIAKKALPIAGKAIGTYFGGAKGGSIGQDLGRTATRLFELELEGLSPEDQEFEISKAYVRFAKAAMQKGANLARSGAGSSPQQIAKAALKNAASQHAPGLLANRSGKGRSGGSSGRNRKGNWLRKGNTIVLYGL